MKPPSPWNSGSENIVRQLYTEGKSFGLIAAALCGAGYRATRNSVAGKISRMKLPPRPQKTPFENQRPKITITRSLEQKSSTVRSHPLRTTPLPSEDGSGSVPFIEIRDGQCKAIIAYQDGQLSKAVCCGRKTRRVVIRGRVRAKSWCDDHEAIYIREIA